MSDGVIQFSTGKFILEYQTSDIRHQTKREMVPNKIAVLTAIIVYVLSSPIGAEQTQQQIVVMLHGLARSDNSMNKMQDAIAAQDFKTCNIAYPSRDFTIEVLAAEKVLPKVLECTGGSEAPIHFVTHSLGGILVRQISQIDSELTIGRVVMLGPPNGGSEVVDKLGDLALFRWINGPAGQQLGTSADATPRALGPVDFELGIIAGKKSINLILSRLIPGKDDGKVSIENAKLEGMQDFLIVPVSHPFLMRDKYVIEQTLNFLQAGQFERDE
ncbi:MAG TPA: alpha/beta hydrolase [Cellvibrionaceae bacterium]